MCFRSWLCYLSVYIVGQTFLSFQWDILLLEVGALAVLLDRPLPASFKWLPGSSPSVRWLIRFLLFKLMFMAGVVKVQANCPTWLNLTALDYHYATQVRSCIAIHREWYTVIDGAFSPKARVRMRALESLACRAL